MNLNKSYARRHTLLLGLATASLIGVVGNHAAGDTLVSDPLERAYQAAWSPDGTRLAYLSDTNGDYIFNLYVVDADGSNQTLLIPETDAILPTRGLAWAVNGIYFRSGAVREIYVIQPDGSGLERLTFNDVARRYPLGFVDVTADGAEMVFTADNGSSGWYDVFAAPTDGSGTQCEINPGGGHTDDFSLGSDGTVYYATASDHDLPHTIYTDDITCTTSDITTCVTGNPLGNLIEYVVSPNGSRLVYSDGSAGARVLKVGDALGCDAIVVANVGDNCFGRLNSLDRILPRPREVWTPDSAWLFYASNELGSYNIHAVTADGSARAVVTTDAGATDYVPALSPDGTVLMYIKDDGAARELYVKTLGSSIDCNANSVIDSNDIADGTSSDCNTNGVPDECEQDFDGDGEIDDCDSDIDNDGVGNEPDVCDYTPPGTEVDEGGRPLGDVNLDCDADLRDYAILQNNLTGPLPQQPYPDCNGNGVSDDMDIATGTSQDCNGDGLPDECSGTTDALVESWEGIPSLPSDEWAIACDASVCASINEKEGNPAPSVNVGGTGGGVGTTSHLFNTQYLPDFSCGLVMESDFWLDGSGCHFTGAMMGLVQTSEPYLYDGAPWLVFMWFNKGCVDNALNVGINMGLPSEEGTSFIPETYTPNAWNRGRIVIRPDHRVEFYVKKPSDADFVRLWTSTNPIDTSFNRQAAILYTGKEGGGPARVDNMLVQESVGCDCNGNGTPDDCDVTDGTSSDVDGNGIPDECEG